MTLGDTYLREVISNLKEYIPLDLINLWFGKATATDFDGNSITIVAENDFKKNIIIKRYLERVEKEFQNVCGRYVRVMVTSRDDVTEEETEIFSDAKKPETIEKTDKKENTDKVEGMIPGIAGGYTFENFVVGSSNKVAHAACYSIATNPIIQINPLFIYGPSGLGKTHLLFAIMNEAKRRNPNINLLYVTGEEFTNEIIDAITAKNAKSTAFFRDKYRSVDILLVDDIQFIAGKMTVQEEFFHTFDTLYKMQKQVVLTSDKPPRDMDLLEDRLRTRFEMGLITDIQPPETELRTAIFKQKTMSLGFEIPNDVLAYMAENICSNVRQIEGAVKKLWAQSFITNERITLEMAQTVLADYFSTNKRVITPDFILSLLERRYAIKKEDMLGKKRTGELVYVRHLAIYLIQEYTDLSLKKTGKLFERDHSTIISARDNVIKRMKEDASFSKEVADLRKEIEEQ